MNTRRYPQSINPARHTHDGGHGITQSGVYYGCKTACGAAPSANGSLAPRALMQGFLHVYVGRMLESLKVAPIVALYARAVDTCGAALTRAVGLLR